MAERSWLIGCAVLVVAVSAQDRSDFFAVGGNLSLTVRPPPKVNITSVVWKHDGDLLAEWVQEDGQQLYFGSYKGRTTLDITTGRLHLTGMTEADVGLYTVEINSKLQDQSYSPQVAQQLNKKPEVRPQPVKCGPTMTQCTLACDGATPGNGPITYSWRKDDGQLEETPGEELEIITSQIHHVKKFRCRMKNLVNEVESDPIDNPLFYEDPPFNWAALVGGVLGLVAVGGAVAGYLKRDTIKGWFGTSGTDGDAPSVPAASSPEASESKQPETMPLNSATGERNGATGEGNPA